MRNNVEVLLVSSPTPCPAMHVQNAHVMPPLGLGYLATCLEQERYSTRIIDMALRGKNIETVLSVLKNSKPKVVGISCTTETYQAAERMAKIIKSAHPDCAIVFGGCHTSFEYEVALKEDFIDYVVLNEGEISFTNLCNFIIRGVGTIESVKGIVYKENGLVICTEPEPFIENLDTLPIPDRSLFEDLYEYAHPATISTSRGCPGNCIFCAASVLSGGRYRMRSAQNIVAEFEYLKSLGFDNVIIVDDTLTISMARLESFLDELISRNLQMTWYCESRVDTLSYNLLSKMKKAGLTTIQFGVESGSQAILDSVHKGITLEQIRKAFRWCRELNITPVTNLIVGQPSDSRETIQDTVRMAHELISLGARVTLSVSTPFPGTPMWRTPEKFGVEIIDFDLDNYNVSCPVFNAQHLTAAEIRNEYYLALKEVRIAQRQHNVENDDMGVRRDFSSFWFD
ncbi:MAG: B12-binding domain-containing radical SAM protein [Oscillospiraceae bacterium]|nr:B12-binding domain-containing radical SAM protein [Oscillospiraceae bacterium]